MAQRIDPDMTRAPEAALLLSSRVTVPQHVVYRTFPSETVVLNLQTGRYHGLNVTAGRMLQALERSTSVRDAVGLMASECEQGVLVVRRDLCELCWRLLDRGLIEIDADSPG
jgi:hypothetical protein